jgi:hypothetical protein
MQCVRSVYAVCTQCVCSARVRSVYAVCTQRVCSVYAACMEYMFPELCTYKMFIVVMALHSVGSSPLKMLLCSPLQVGHVHQKEQCLLPKHGMHAT